MCIQQHSINRIVLTTPYGLEITVRSLSIPYLEMWPAHLQTARFGMPMKCSKPYAAAAAPTARLSQRASHCKRNSGASGRATAAAASFAARLSPVISLPPRPARTITVSSDHRQLSIHPSRNVSAAAAASAGAGAGGSSDDRAAAGSWFNPSVAVRILVSDAGGCGNRH
jgi:hypothetical protein